MGHLHHRGIYRVRSDARARVTVAVPLDKFVGAEIMAQKFMLEMPPDTPLSVPICEMGRGLECQ